MLRQLLGCGFVFGLFALAGTGPAAQAQEKLRHPRLHAALYELRQARLELKNSREDFGGHRDKALAATDDAIRSLGVLLQIKGDNIRGINREPGFYKRHPNHAHIRQALIDLREARNELGTAKGDFRDGRERAERDIDIAIRQLEFVVKGIR